MANGLPPLEKLKKKELPPLNSLKKKGDGTPQPETTSQPTGVITQPLAQGAQQGTQPQFTSWRDVAPPEVQEIQDVTATRKPISLQDKKVEGALKERAFNVISEEINNIEKADKAPDTFEYGKQFLKQRDGVDTQYQPKTKEQSLQEINRQVKDVYPNLQTTTINESGQTVYTDELQNGINALFVSKQNREAESNDKFLATVSRYKEMPSIFKPAMGVVLSVDALAYDIASLATQFVGADELTLYLRNKVEDWNQEKSALQASSGVTLEQQQKGAFATIKEDPIAGLKLLGYQTLDAIPSMAAIILAPEVSVGRTGAIQLSRGAAQQFVTPIASNVYKQALKDAYKTLGTRSNTGITALSGLESRSAYEDAISSGLSREEAIGIAMLKGISVYATEHVFMGAEDMVRNSLVNYGQDAAKNTVKKGMKDYLKEVGEQFSKEGLLEEGTVNLIGQIIDNAAQGKEFDIYSYLDESAVGGLMGAGSVSLKTVLDNTSSLVSTIMTNSELKQKGKVISELRKELENNIDLSQQDKESLKSALITAQKEYDDIRKEQDDLINKFSDEDKQSYIDINRNILSTIDKSRRTDNDVVKNVLNEKLKTLAQEKQAIEEKYASQEMSSKTGEILDTEKTPVVTEEEEKAPEVFEEEIVIPEEEIEKLNYDIARVEDEGTFGDNINQKAYRGSEEGMIKIDPQNENTIIFETNDKIYELGNKDEIGSELLSSQDITLTPPEGVNVVPKTNKTDVVSIDGKEYTVIGRRRDKKGKAVVRVKEVDTGLERRFVGEKAERILKDYNLRQGGKKVDIPDVKKQTEKPVVKTETKEEKRARKVEEKRKLEEMNQQEFDDAVAKSEKEVAEFEKAALDEAVKKAEKNKNKDLVQVNGNVYQVTKKDDGTFSVTKMREDGKLVRITDKAETSKAVAQFKREKTNQEKAALKEAEKMIKDVKKEEQDKILNLLDKLIDSTSSRGRVYDATLALPMFVANSSLKIVRASYKAGKSIAEAIKDGYNYVKSKGYGITEQEYKKYVAQNINKQQQSDTQDKAGIPSKEQKGQEPKQAKPKQEASGEKAETGRDVQTPKEKGRVTPDKTKEEVRVEPDEKEVKEVAEKAGITPKNLKDLYKIGRDMFGLNKVQAFAQAVVMDRMVGAMAKRAGISKKEMYGKIEFRKASEKDIPQGVKFQVDAWHGSPYQFDKFTTQAIGTGEGAQAFGWGLYFTDLESIARNYADNLTTQKIDFKFKNDIDDNFLDIFTRKIGYVFESDRMVFIEAKQYFDKTLKGKSDTIISESGKTLLTPTGKFKKFFPKIDDLGLKEFADYSLENNNNIEFERKRNLYKVSLHKGKTPDQYTWLEWDKPVGRKKIKSFIDYVSGLSENFKKYYADDYLQNLQDGNYDHINGNDFYNGIAKSAMQNIGKPSPKDVSLALLKVGIDGIKYPAESVSRGLTSVNARGFNYVVFDENAVSIEEVIKFQKDAVKARGAMMMAMDGRAIIYALEDPNVSTPLHELAHVFEHYLTEAERTSVLKWANSKEWTVDVSEKFARGFEKFLADGKAPTVSLQKIFDRFKEWLTDIYKGIKGSEIDIELNKPMKDIYAKMLGGDVQAPTEKEVEDVAKKTGITPKNLRDLYKINRDMFGLNKVKAFAQAVVMDRMIGAMAKRAGISKKEMYGKIEFRKASEKDIPQGVKFQVDAWHGSPYQFDKFTTEKMGTGEGAQAFGWGLYFTDLESIARGYADRLRIGNEGVVINNIAQEALNSHKGDVKKALEELNSTLKESWADKKRVKKAIKILETGKFIKIPKTNLYKVSLHKGKTPDQYTWLEWDKPVSNEQWNKLDKQVETEFGERAFYEFVKNNKNAFNGETIYKEFSKFIGGDKEASLFLLRAGIDGVKYPAESISRGATSDTARGFNYVVFDENAVSIEEVIKFQKDAVKARGAMMMAMDGKAIIYALEDPNVSTPLHELAHVFEHYLTEAERNSVLKWANSKEWTVDVSEKFARGFEKYLADGKAPTVSLQKIFNRFKEWLTDIYNGIVGSDIDIQLNDEMRDLYGKMLGVDAVKEQEKKSFANIIRGLKIDTTGKAFDATLGLPVAIYNNAIEITAKAVEAGVEVKKAIQKGIDYANKKMNGKKWDVEGFRNQLLTTIKGQFEQQAAQMRSSKKEVKTPKTRFLGFLTRSGAKIVNANDYIDSMKTNMNLDVSDTKKRIDDAKSKARKVFAKTNKIKNDKEVANIVNDLLNRIISPDEYNMTAQEAIDKIRKDIKNPKVAQELIDAGLDIRTQIDNMTKFMLENAEKFNLSDEAIENLKSNIGNYIHREYMFFSERGKTFRKQSLKTRRLEKWNPTDEMINEAIAEHAIYNGISVDEAKKQIEDLIEDWKKKRTPIKVTGNNVIRIQDVKVEADLMKGRVRIPQNFTLFSEASKEAEKELQKKGIDSENKNYNTLLSVETERIYKDKGGEYVELPPHLRKLLGEERNATQRYINTMLAMSNMVYKAQAMDMIVKSFDGKDGWIYDKEPANNEGDYKLVNDKYSPLNGKWVNIYLIEEFNKLPIYETDLAIAKAYFEYQSLVRTTKTVANSPTNFKNVIGGIFAQMQNGFFIALTNPKLAALSIYSRGHLYFKGRRNELAKQVLKDGAEAGVLSSSVDVEVLGLKGSILSERVKFGKSELGRRYAQQDDWTKSLMVYLYKQDVSLMLFGKKFDDLSKDQQKEVLIKTGSLTKKGVPTFSNLPSWFRTISRLPTGDFMSFTVEATRSLIGSGIIAYEHARAASTGVDSKGNTINETQRRAYAKDAAKRIAGLVAIQSVGKAIGAGAFSLGGSAIEYGSQVFAAIFGGGDDEDENDETKLAKIQVVKEINKTIPDWAVGDRVMVTNVDDDGNVTFYNWTGLEPSSETAQLIGGNFKYFEQFYKGSITAKMLIQLYNNENEIGNEIYLEDEPLYKQVFNSAYFLGKNTLLPPFINSTEYEIKRRKEDDENFGVISQDNTVEENAQSAKELTQVFLSRATIRSYNYNIYNRVKQIAYAQSRHGRVDNLDNIKEEEQIDLRLKNISVIRDAYQICLKHRITTSDSPAKIKKISELNDAVKRNYTDFEEAMIYETDDAKFKEMYDFVMSKSKDIVEYNKLKDERKK